MAFCASIKYYFHRRGAKSAKFAKKRKEKRYIKIFNLCELCVLSDFAVILTNNPSVSLWFPR